MNLTLQRLDSFVARFDPESLTAFRASLAAASEVVVIGSAVIGTLNPNSDVDLLLIGRGERLKSQYLDLIWVQPDQLHSERWLGSELATHTATYGIWLKGAGQWRHDVFFSSFAVAHKIERILTRLVRVYLKRKTLAHDSFVQLITRCVLDMQRAVLLARKVAVPPTPQLIVEFLNDPQKTYESISKAELLGDWGRYLIEHFIPRPDVEIYLRKQVENLSLARRSTVFRHKISKADFAARSREIFALYAPTQKGRLKQAYREFIEVVSRKTPEQRFKILEELERYSLSEAPHHKLGLNREGVLQADKLKKIMRILDFETT